MGDGTLLPVQVAFILGLLNPDQRSRQLRMQAGFKPEWARRTTVKIKTWTYALVAAGAAYAALIAGGHYAGSDEAFANQCAAQCYAQENACRKAKAGDPSCDAELTKCLQSCRGK
jgi:hypothetical protein